ncbi:molybdopterin-dependent oxidoreductase [Alicyclobacillus pomorum]|uniref:molybdopterin-dependent oxidoreductase n=1 Tax=Alicyclobacillus pomorum TaxID=204470 RepID=UPI000A052679
MHPDTLLALCMNCEPLSVEHGCPLRLIVPGWTDRTLFTPNSSPTNMKVVATLFVHVDEISQVPSGARFVDNYDTGCIPHQPRQRQ